MALTPAGVQLVIEGQQQFLAGMDGAEKSVLSFGGVADRVGGMLGGFAKAAAGVAALAGGALVAGIGGAAAAGFGFNNAMEQASAKINAFTKDAGATAEILEMVKARASQTPFAFEEMAGAAAALGPAAKSSGKPLEELIATAEILAASNPAEGLEGASFAIKEALSGDYTSLIERFNLSRSAINDLKEQGVPALEIIGQAMKDAGYDADLVSALAATAEGRLSTFKDTFTNLAGTVTQPIFDAFSAGLGKVNDELAAGTPTLNSAAAAIGQALVPAAEWLGGAMAGAAKGVVEFVKGGQALFGLFESGASIDDKATSFATLIDVFGQEGAASLVGGVQTIRGAFDTLGEGVGYIVGEFTYFMDAITNGDGTLKSFSETSGIAVQLVLDQFARLLGIDLGAFKQGWAGVGAEVSAIFGELGARIGEFAIGIGQQIVAAAPGMLASLQGLGQQLLGWAAQQAPGWLASLQVLGAALGQWVADNVPIMLGRLLEARNALVGWVLDSLPAWAAQLAVLGQAMYQWVVDALPGLGTALGEVAATLLAGTGQLIAIAVPKLLELGGMFVTWIATDVLPKLPGQLVTIGAALLTGIGNFIAQVTPEIVKLAKQFIDWVQKEVLPKAPGELAKIGAAIVTGIGAFIGNVGTEAAKIGTAIGDGIKSGFAAAWGRVKQWIAEQIAKIPEPVRKALGIASPSKLMADLVGQPMAEGVAQGIGQGAPAIEESALSAVEGGADAAAGAAPRLGKSISDGLARGISAGIGAVKSAALKVALASKEAMQASLKIASPSGVFADDVGAPIVQGMAQGMLDNLGVLLDAAGKISWAVLDEAKAFAGTIEDAVGPLLAAAYQAAADFARGQLSALDVYDQLGELQDAALDKTAIREASKERDKAKRELDALRQGGETAKIDENLRDLDTEAESLRATAATNIDPKKREQAEARLLEIDQERANLERERRDAEAERATAITAAEANWAYWHDKQNAAQDEARKKQAEAQKAVDAQRAIADQARMDIVATQKEALKLNHPTERAAFLKLRTDQINELAQFDQQAAKAATDEERARMAERRQLLLTAQQQEFLLYQQQAKERQGAQDAALRDAEAAMKALGNLIYFSQEDVYGAGSDAIKGLSKGMLDGLTTLRGTLGASLAEVLASVKKAMGIASPSQLFAEQVGAPLALGIAAGFQEQLRLATPQFTASVQALVTPVQRAATAPAISYSDNRSVSISAPGATGETVARIEQIARGVVSRASFRSDQIRRSR